MEFKDIFYSERKKRGLNQEQIASVLHVSKSSIAMWETGKRVPSTSMMENIADYFNMDIDYLYGRKDIDRDIKLFDPKGDVRIEFEPINDIKMPTQEEMEKAINFMRAISYKLTTEELELILAYREKTKEFQEAIRTLLGL